MEQEKIGTMIASLRKEKGLTQEQFGELLGVSNRTVSRWETGRNLPDLSMLMPICELLGISVSELLCGERTSEETIAVEAVVEYSHHSSEEKSRKLNRHFSVAAVCVVMFLLHRQFGVLNMIFQPNAAEFVSGALVSIGILCEFIGFYNNNHSVTLRQRKQQWLKKQRKTK